MTEPRELIPERHLADYLLVLRKHQWLITGIFLAAVVTVGVWTFRQIPVYQAAATILIDPEAPKIVNIQEVTPVGAAGPYDPAFYPTQYEIIKSRAVLNKTIEALKLKRSPELATEAVLRSSLFVEPRRNTRLVLITVEQSDPVLAAEVAESAVALQNYRVKAGILGLEVQRKITAQKIMDFNKAYLEAQAQRLAMEAKVQQITQIAKDKSAAQLITGVANSPLIDKLRGELADLEVERSRLLRTYKEEHPEILKIDARIQQVQQRLDGEVQNMVSAAQAEYKAAKAREDTLFNTVTQMRREGQDLNEKEIQYLALQRENETNQQLYDSIAKRLKETSVTGGLETNNVRVVEAATAPSAPVRPRKAWNLGLAVVVGLGLGIALAVAIEYFDTTVKTPDDVERYLGLPVIGIVPRFQAKR